jgi:transposase
LPWRIVAALLLCVQTGCNPLSVLPDSRTATSPPIPEYSTGQAKCKIAASHESPLVTEWPASEKANLEAQLRSGTVVVSYSGCEMRLLPQCRTPGTYAWRRTTTSTDVVEIRNADDLYAKLPLGAVSLEGELARTGRLAVQTTVSGQLQLVDFDPRRVPADASCQGATHVVGALSVGAFKLRSGGTFDASGKVEAQKIGTAGGNTAREESLVREAGVPARCEESTDTTAHPECASPVQVFLRPLPATVADRGPPGMVKVRFLPVEANVRWDISVGDRTLCAAPCEKWVDPAMPFSFKNDPGALQRNVYIDVPDLRDHMTSDHLQIKATPRSMGEFVGGIVATTFSGIAVLTGTALTAVGCRDEGAKGMCTAGLITLPIGLAGLGPSIWMIVDSSPEVDIRPYTPGMTTPETATF